MKLWELIKWCTDGAYVGGEYFKSESGKLLWFDGKTIHGMHQVGLNESIEYVED